MEKLKLIIVANKAQWASWAEKITNIKSFFSSKVDFDVTLSHTQFDTIPFITFVPEDTKEFSGDAKTILGIDPTWYDQNITSIAKGYDIVLFVTELGIWPVSDQARGWRTDRDQGPVELQIGTVETEATYCNNVLLWNLAEHLSEHEILHALFMITGQPDRTHYWDYVVGNLGGALAEIDFGFNTKTIQSLKNQLIGLITQALNLLYQQVKNMQPTTPLLDKMCLAIQDHEGYYPGSKSYVNNNPGNLRYAHQVGATGVDASGFATFGTYQDGMNALKRQITIAASGNSKVYSKMMTLAEFFATYAPSSDHNDPVIYAQKVATAMGVTTSFQIKDLLA